MSASLHLAGPEDMKKLLPLVRAFHEERRIEITEAVRQAGLAPLLAGSSYGAVYLIGPRAAPVGYVALAFGWSVALGGMNGFVDEFFVRPAVRGRGVGGEALLTLLPQLSQAGIRALHMEVDRENPKAKALYRRWGFLVRDGAQLATWRA
ncbi:MAG: GNAT family N-acetyltransferase [Pseudomonadota bacterium]